MKNHIFPALKLSLLLLVTLVVIYPLAVLVFAKGLGVNHGKGETISYNSGKNEKYGYAIVGQAFTEDKYFNTRPSAVNYNSAGSGGSNKGSSNPEYLATVAARIDTFLVHNPTIKKADIPVELVTASGSGLDPDISPEAALVQVSRIATVRNIQTDYLKKLIAKHTEKPLFGLFGPAKVNVLKLNIDLDKIAVNH
jgi:potassium-transporting ATPase KdpC subunit